MKNASFEVPINRSIGLNHYYLSFHSKFTRITQVVLSSAKIAICMRHHERKILITDEAMIDMRQHFCSTCKCCVESWRDATRKYLIRFLINVSY